MKLENLMSKIYPQLGRKRSVLCGVIQSTRYGLVNY